MQNFQFFNPTKILFGKGQIALLNQEIPKGSRVLITYGGGSIKKNGVHAQVINALKGYEVSEFGGIEPNPTYETLMLAVDIVKAEGIDFLLAVGGGSVIDGTKFIAAAAVYEGEPWEILSKRGAGIKEALPFGSVLTLPATGSEMNMGSVVTRQSTKDKLAFMHPAVFPVFSILDPETTYTLPPRQIGNGIVDAFTHIMEQYMTVRTGTDVQDRLAEALLLTLIHEGPKALKDPQNYEARATLMWAATLALNGLIGAGVPHDWATHMVGHEITALHGLDHAQTLAIILPAMLTVRLKEKSPRLAQYAQRVWGITTGSEEEMAIASIQKTREFFESVGVKTRLSDYQISSDAIPALLNQLNRHHMIALGENQSVTLEVSQKVLETAI